MPVRVQRQVGSDSAENRVPLLCSSSTIVDVPVINQLATIFYGGYGGDEHGGLVWGGFFSAVLKPFFALLPLSQSWAPVFGAFDDEEFFVVDSSCTIRP